MLRRALLLTMLASAPNVAAGQEVKPSQPVYRYLYDAKLVCGVVALHEYQAAKHVLPAGAYATVANLFNPHPSPLQLDFRLALTHPPREMQAGAVTELAPLTIPPERALAVDCRTIESLHFPYGFPDPLLKGMLTVDSLQPLAVTVVWSTATPDSHHRADRLTSLDVERIEARLVEVVPADPEWSGDGGGGLCDRLRRTSTVVTGLAEAQSYTYDEAPGEGAREVTRVGDIEVLAGTGGVVEGPIAVRLERGLLPDGRFVDTSEMPVLTVGERYLLMLPNYGWRIEPFPADSVLRIETLGDREFLVDQEGYAVTGPRGERLPEQVSTPERLFQPPELTLSAVDPTALSVEDYAAALTAAAAECDGPVIAGPFTAFPLVPVDAQEGD